MRKQPGGGEASEATAPIRSCSNLQGEEGSRPNNPFCSPATGPSGKNRGIHQTNLQHPSSTHIRVPQVAHCCIFFRT